MSQYRDLEKQIKAYADGQTPDLFDRLSEWEDRADAPIVLPLPRKSHALRAASLAACFVLLCGGLFVYLNRPKTDSMIQGVTAAGQAADTSMEDDALEIVEDCEDLDYDEDTLEAVWDDASDDAALIEDGTEGALPAPQEDDSAVLLSEDAPVSGEEEPLQEEAPAQPENAPESSGAPPAQAGGAKLRSEGDYGQEAAASSAEPGEGSAEMDPGYSFRPEKTEPEDDSRAEDDAEIPLTAGTDSSGKQEKSAADEPAVSAAPAAPADEALPDIGAGGETGGSAPEEEALDMAPAMGESEKKTAEDSAPADGEAAAQDGGMMLFSAGANSQDAEDSSPVEEPQGAERLVDETTILRSLGAVTPARFAASAAARDAAPLAAEGEPAPPEAQALPESGVPAGEPVNGAASPQEEAAPEAQPKPDPAKELETVLVETGLTHLALNWMPEGFALEKAYTVSGDEPEDVKTGVAMYALAPEGAQKTGEGAAQTGAETADAPKAEAAAAENGDSPKAPEEKCPPRPSLTVSAKAQTETMVLPAGEEWTVLFHDQKALVKHEIQMDGNTVLRDEFTAVFTRNGYRYEVKGTLVAQEDFFLAVQSIFWTPQA